MSLKHYYEIIAKDYYELGLKKGELFGDFLRESIEFQKQEYPWNVKLLSRLEPYLKITKKIFPHLVEELQGYAEGAGVPFSDLWLLNLEDELQETEIDKCTSIATNNGLLIAHNEDWDAESELSICVLKKTIGSLTILELFYLNTLGGNSVSINSHGYVQTINTLTHADKQIGVPRNIIARWLSETQSPEDDYYKLANIKRSSGYNHNIVSVNGTIWNIECSAKKQNLTIPECPFVHTNHFLTELCKLEKDDNSCGTFERFNYASSKVRKSMSLDELERFMSNTSEGRATSIFNEATIARMIINLERMIAYIWLLREKEKGWVEYGLDFINGR